MTYRLDASQHANISSKVCRLEDGLVVFLEVQVDHQRLQLLTDDPRLVFHIPAMKKAHVRIIRGYFTRSESSLKSGILGINSYPMNNPKSRFLP